MPHSESIPPFPTTRLGGVSLPSTPLVKAAYRYTHLHTSPTVANHTICSAFFSLILREKLVQFSTVNPETVVIATLLHDLGRSFTPELVSKDKRFEVDGANVA
jgi:5'-deoxynucleotidase YfbR-like HD superfamily hydrolase